MASARSIVGQYTKTKSPGGGARGSFRRTQLPESASTVMINHGGLKRLNG